MGRSVGWLVSALLAISLTIGACADGPIPIRTQPSPGPSTVCALALGGGTLVADATDGLAVAKSDGRIVAVDWPYGFSARMAGGRLALIDRRGSIVARVGDSLSFGGGFGEAGRWLVCPDSIEVTPEASP